MDYHFCTIATLNYLPYVKALHFSLQQQSAHCRLHVLFIDADCTEPDKESLRFYSLAHVIDTRYAEEMILKYGKENDHLRWGLKPVFLSWLLKDHDNVIYLDVDIFFFRPYDFIFQQLATHSILLTPHWASFLPLPHTADFELNYKIGLFNAGFVAASKQAIPTLQWWAELCLYKMAKDFSTGYFVDQKYLDLLLLVDEKAGILRHQGCNVAGWNIHQNIRSLLNDEVVINGRYPIIFVHFNQSTLEQIEQGHDSLLRKHLIEYKAAFKHHGHDYDELKPEFKEKKPRSFIQLKRSIRLRTRVKNILFKLYQKI